MLRLSFPGRTAAKNVGFLPSPFCQKSAGFSGSAMPKAPCFWRYQIAKKRRVLYGQKCRKGRVSVSIELPKRIGFCAMRLDEPSHAFKTGRGLQRKKKRAESAKNRSAFSGIRSQNRKGKMPNASGFSGRAAAKDVGLPSSPLCRKAPGFSRSAMP